MKIAFVIEYFPPFAAGGSEWSTYYLAKDLAKMGHNVLVITPNFGTKSQEIQGNLKIVRYPYAKLKNQHNLPGNFSLTNPIWFVFSTIHIWLILKKEKPEIIHVHGKYSIPPTYAANILLKKPLVATLRDYQTVCNYGLCLFNKDTACNLKEYFQVDFKKYLNEYVPKKNAIKYALNLIFALYGRLATNYLKFIVNKLDIVTCLSEKQKIILKKNGLITKCEVIRTSFNFSKSGKRENNNNILYVGRLTYGKGIALFLEALTLVMEQVNVRVNIIGQGRYSSKVKEFAKRYKSVKYNNFLSHDEVQKYFKKSAITVVPSLWPDPLPRVALESIANGTPVIATKSGGLPEVVLNNKYGYLASTNSRDLAEKIILGLKRQNKLRSNIAIDRQKLSNAYGRSISAEYLHLYTKTIILKLRPRQKLS